MKPKLIFYSLFILFASLASCKKDGNNKSDSASLSATFYIRDKNGVPQPAQIDYYLIDSQYKYFLSLPSTVAYYCPTYSIPAFKGTGVHKKADVPPGDYFLVAQVSKLEKEENWYRYSIKELHINKGDKLNETKVFIFKNTVEYEEWNRLE